MPLSIRNAQASPCNKESSVFQMSIVPTLRNTAIDSTLSLSKIMSPKFSNFPCRELYSENVRRFWKDQNVPLGRSVVFFSIALGNFLFVYFVYLFAHELLLGQKLGPQIFFYPPTTLYMHMALYATGTQHLLLLMILIKVRIYWAHIISGNFLILLLYCSNLSTSLWDMSYDYPHFTNLGTKSSGV